MTKFILHGGGLWESEDKGKKLVEELVRDATSEPVKILICYFARPESKWADVFIAQSAQFATFNLNKKYELQMAQPEQFISQLDWADSLFIIGGDDSRLRTLLEQTLEWVEKLEGKTVAGSSAGVDILSKYYYNLDTLELEEGFGLLPIKVLVHYRSNYNAPNLDWDRA